MKPWAPAARSCFFFLVLSFLITPQQQLHAAGRKNDILEKRSAPGEYSGYSEAAYKGFKYHSVYVTMPDSVQLAVDYYLPKGLDEGEKVPTILYLTRYIRSLEAKAFIRWLQDPVFGQVSKEEVKYFTQHGYAVVIVDVRGTGASTGVRTMEFSPEEVADGGRVVDWIIAQNWSNGNVGSTGISYLGTTAEMLLVNKHPNVKACIPRSNIFDLYNHMAWPGGVAHSEFVKVWRNTTYALDNNELEYISKRAKRLIKGPHPVQGDKKRRILKQAVEDHQANFDIFKHLFDIQFRDEAHPLLDRTLDDFSIHSYADDISASGTPMYRIGGWWDGALAKSAISGYLTTSNSEKLLIGPWDHGPDQHISPFRNNPEMDFDLYAEMLRYFDYHLKGVDNGIAQEQPIRYYTLGSEQWQSSDEWPPAESEEVIFYLTPDQILSEGKRASSEGMLTHHIDTLVGTGGGAGWNSQTGKYRYEEVIAYPNRKQMNERMLLFDSPVMPADREITGHPIVDLHLSTDADDGAIFVYLEDVHPNGDVYYITEGQMRFIHRNVSKEQPDLVQWGPYHSFEQDDAMPVQPGKLFELSFDLIPTSYLLQKGHKLRLSISGVDRDHFEFRHFDNSVLHIAAGGKNASRLRLPLVDR